MIEFNRLTGNEPKSYLLLISNLLCLMSDDFIFSERALSSLKSKIVWHLDSE